MTACMGVYLVVAEWQTSCLQISSHSRFPRRPTCVHLMCLHIHHMLHTLLHELRQHHLACILLQMLLIVRQHQLVNIDLTDTTLDALLRDFIFEPIRPMQHQPHATFSLRSDRLKSTSYQSEQASNTTQNITTHLFQSKFGPLGPYSP